jgi:hypothetical protein
VRYRSLASI